MRSTGSTQGLSKDDNKSNPHDGVEMSGTSQRHVNLQSYKTDKTEDFMRPQTERRDKRTDRRT